MENAKQQAEKKWNGLLCVCGAYMPARGEPLDRVARIKGWRFYPNSPHADVNAYCAGCQQLDDE